MKIVSYTPQIISATLHETAPIDVWFSETLEQQQKEKEMNEQTNKRAKLSSLKVEEEMFFLRLLWSYIFVTITNAIGLLYVRRSQATC